MSGTTSARPRAADPTVHPVHRRRRLDRVRATGLLLWLLLAVVVLANSHGVLVVDIKPEVYLEPWRSFRSYFSAWAPDPQLGFPSVNVGLAPVAGVVGVLQWLGASAALSMKLLRLGLLTVGALGAARLLRHLHPGAGARRAGLVAAVVYVANPYVVVAGAALGVLWPYTLLPWLTWAVMRAVETGRGWRWPAVSGLLFMATTGMNAGVIALLQLVAVPPFVVLAARRSGRSGRAVLGVLARCAAMAAVLSLYWLVPTVSALGAGTTVVDNSETTTGIATTSSLAEVLRGLGIWPLYGGTAAGPWVPEHAGYVTSVWQLVWSYLFTVVAGLGVVVARGRVRVAALAGLVLAAVVMVGLYPVAHPTVFGRVLGAAFDHVPGLAALRTTNKAGAGLVLCAAVLVGSAAVRFLRRRPDRTTATVVGLGLLAAVLLSAVPALDGNLYTSPLRVPAYWRSAAAALDRGNPDQRVWLVPGQDQASYRWTVDRPDDITNSLLDRPALIRTVIPVTAPVAANLLAAADTQLQEQTLPPDGLSTYARYLGVGDLLVRNDLRWETAFGARPAVVQATVNADPGLVPEGNFGAPGQETLSPTVQPLDYAESVLPPLQRYGVTAAVPPLHATALSGTAVLVGDGYGVAAARGTGLLRTGESFRYLAELPAAQLKSLLGVGHRIVLTDTDRRRTTVSGRLVGGQGPLLAADQDPGPTRTLWDPEDQTVLETTGGTVRATQVGSVFGTLPDAAPENAFDHDLSTSWLFGDFGTGRGQSITLTLPSPRTVGPVTVLAPVLGPQRVDRLRVSAGGRSVLATVDATGTARADLRGVQAQSVTVTVDRVRGTGFNRLGIAEVQVGDAAAVTRWARTPLTLQRTVARMSTADRTLLHETPLDVVLSRVWAQPGNAQEEGALRRVVTLPDARSYTTYGVLRPGADLAEPTLDELAGADGSVVAVSSSHAFSLPTVRASEALDGRLDTSWVPGGKVAGESLTVQASPRTVDRVTVTQPARTADLATSAEVRLDGRLVANGPLGAGRRTLTFPATRASTLTLTLTGRSGSGFVRVEEVGWGAARVQPDPTRAAAACVPLASVDGRAVLGRPTRPLSDLSAVPFVGCGRTDLASGRHRVSPVAGWTLDRLVLRDVLGQLPTTTPAGPALQTTRSGQTSYTVRAAATTAPWTLVLGQAFDPRWRATADGHDLGAPQVVDGYSAGWVVPAGDARTIQVRYGPQRASDIALAVSAVGLVGAAALAVVGSSEPASPGTGPVVPAARSRRRGRGRPDATWWLVGALCAGLVFGWTYAALALALAVWHRERPPRPRTLLLAGLACWVLLPVAWVAGNLDDLGHVTPDLVAQNPWPHRLAVVGLLLLVAGVVLQERARRSGTLTRDE